MWVSFKCEKCSTEIVDFIDKEEVTELKKSYKQDKHGQFIVTCEQCE